MVVLVPNGLKMNVAAAAADGTERESCAFSGGCCWVYRQRFVFRHRQARVSCGWNTRKRNHLLHPKYANVSSPEPTRCFLATVLVYATAG